MPPLQLKRQVTQESLTKEFKILKTRDQPSQIDSQKNQPREKSKENKTLVLIS